MSATEDGLYPIRMQKAVIGADLSSTFLFVYLMGIYIGGYGWAMYVYATRSKGSSSTRGIIMGTITALFAFTMVDMCVQWYYMIREFTVPGDTRLSLFLQSATGVSAQPAVNLLTFVLGNVGNILADGLMLWRCFHASGHSWKIMALPIALSIAEFGLIVTNNVFAGLILFVEKFQTPERNRQVNIIGGSMLSTVSLTNLIMTFIICYRIYSKTFRHRQLPGRYKHIISILIQSSAIYSFSSLLSAVTNLIDTGEVASSVLADVVGDFAQAISIVAVGLAPTLMVAQLATMPESSEGSTEVYSTNVPPELRSRAHDDGYFNDSDATEATPKDEIMLIEFPQSSMSKIEGEVLV
ncbi:hypothetical protein CPC08DRAFT_755197 [Agrocybe pediades]|nr:hypothetical protein CPC08DRAFT_755197 [Agrocybe pediades]